MTYTQVGKTLTPMQAPTLELQHILQRMTTYTYYTSLMMNLSARHTRRAAEQEGRTIHRTMRLNVCVCVYGNVHIISLLTGRKGGVSLQCPLFSQEEEAALDGSLCTEILHQSVHSLPGPTERERERENFRESPL